LQESVWISPEERLGSSTTTIYPGESASSPATAFTIGRITASASSTNICILTRNSTHHRYDTSNSSTSAHHWKENRSSFSSARAFITGRIPATTSSAATALIAGRKTDQQPHQQQHSSKVAYQQQHPQQQQRSSQEGK
jgi:hypothetical protein